MNTSNNPSQAVPKSYLNSFVIRSTLIFACGALLTATALYLAPRDQGLSYADNFRIIAELNRGLVTKSLALSFFALLLILAVIVIISIAYSHRVAGPLHKLGMHTRKIASGELSEPVQLRSGDVIQQLAADLNDLSGRYRDVLVEVRAKTRELSSIMDSAEKQGQGSGPVPTNEIAERIDEIRELLNRIKL
jgi:methyl-accepting chemotaxis protein